MQICQICYFCCCFVCFAEMSSAREAGLKRRITAWLARQGFRADPVETSNTATACVKAGLEVPEDWDCLNVDDVPQFKWLRESSREQLRAMAKAATNKGSIGREAKKPRTLTFAGNDNLSRTRSLTACQRVMQSWLSRG